jgi:hypothetical protein
MDAKLQGYIDKLNALNFKDMYNGDFFLTWEKSDDEIEAVFTVANALRYMRETTFPQKYLRAGLESLCSVTTPHVHVSLSLLLVTCLVWKFRIWMRENLRLHTAKLFVKQQT